MLLVAEFTIYCFGGGNVVLYFWPTVLTAVQLLGWYMFKRAENLV